jgi:hypothetical protein
MRLTVHGERNLNCTKVTHETAVGAIIEALGFLSAGMSGVYIFEDETDQASWPHEFDKLCPFAKQ